MWKVARSIPAVLGCRWPESHFYADWNTSDCLFHFHRRFTLLSLTSIPAFDTFISQFFWVLPDNLTSNSRGGHGPQQSSRPPFSSGMHDNFPGDPFRASCSVRGGAMVGQDWHRSRCWIDKPEFIHSDNDRHS